MELFSEIYNCYFQIVDEICKRAQNSPITEKEMLSLASHFGFEESAFLIIPKLIHDWNLLEKNEEGYFSKIDNPEVLPLTILQKRWLKSLLTDERISLFLTPQKKEVLTRYLQEIDPLFLPQDFWYFDRFTDGDNFSSPEYISIFSALLELIRKKQFTRILFLSRRENAISHVYLPCRLEYSAKNDKFRLLALSEKSPDKFRLEIINLSRIDCLQPTDRFFTESPNLEEALRASYSKEPVKLLITTRRNTLERTMLQFSNYEKQTRRIDDIHYECLIYYNRMMETELLIEILSFGPTIQVLGPKDFLAKLKTRIERQKGLFA